MKKVTRYKCEVCGKVFDWEEDCQKCEEGHLSNLEEVYIGSLLFEGFEALPRQLTIGFKNKDKENEWTYARFSLISGTSVTEKTPNNSMRFFKGSNYRKAERN